MNMVRKIPVVIVFILAPWILIRIFGIQPTLDSAWAWVLLILCFVGVVVEFYKSSDVLPRSFRIDLAYSVAATVLASSALTYLWEHKTFYLIDVIIGAVTLVDAWFSPVNSFNSAQRNIQAGVNNGPIHDPS